MGIRATSAETYRIGKLIEEHCAPVGDPAGRVCRYAPGWNDKRVAAEVAKRLSEVHAAHMRREIFGELEGAVKKVTMTENVHLEEMRRDLASALSRIQAIEAHIWPKSLDV